MTSATLSSVGLLVEAGMHPAERMSSDWYVVQTLPRHEKAVTTHLEVDGVLCLLPVTQSLHKWSDRRKLVATPLFPGYTFVQLPDYDRDRLRVLCKPGVVRLVGYTHHATALAAHEIDGIRQLMASGTPCLPHPFIRVGQKVRIRSGALYGLEGILVRLAGRDNLVLGVDLIQKSVSLQLDGYDVEVI